LCLIDPSWEHVLGLENLEEQLDVAGRESDHWTRVFYC
jgi:hypothetical protein